MASIHGGQPLDPSRKSPGSALKAPDVARRNPVGSLIAESSSKPFRAKAKIFSDSPKFLARHPIASSRQYRTKATTRRGFINNDK